MAGPADLRPGGASRRRGDDLIIDIRVQPRASRDEILGVRDGRLRVRTTAPPAGGEANRAVVKLLAKYLGVAPSRIVIRHGAAGRNKQVLVAGPIDVPDGL